MTDTPEQVISPASESPARHTNDENVVSQAENIAKAVQTALAAAVGFGALLTANGFIIVNSYLATFTDIQGYDIAPSQYLAAGACPFALLYQILILALFLYFGRRAVEKWRPSSEYAAFVSAMSRVYLALGAVVAVLAFGYLFGARLYSMLPRAIGGGSPATIVLVFDNVETHQLLRLTGDPMQPRRTGTLLLLAELTDGILVADTNNGHVATVKNDLIVARLDDQVNLGVITPTPTYTPSPTPTTTPSIASTSTS